MNEANLSAGFPILTLLMIVSLLSSFIIALIPSKGKSTEEVALSCRRVSLILSGVILALTLVIFYMGFEPSQKGIQLVEAYPWLGNVSMFKLGVDGLSVSMVLLMGLLLPLTIIASHSIASKTKPKLYYSLLFLLTTAVLGVFLAQDLLLFFVFWEFELLPMYLLISIWGGENRQKAANKFLIFTFLAGAFILAGILLLFWLSGGKTFSMFETAYNFRLIQTLGPLAQNPNIVKGVFLLFLVGFCIKLPSIPFHTWLPEAHVEAPTPVSMLLAGILLKMGGYGLIRFGTEFFPTALVDWAPYIAVLGAINILGAAIFCLVQDDMKRVIAYSSVSHMGFVLLGLATLTSQGINGAIFQMFSHGVISAGLFMLIGVIYERAHTRKISQFQGLAVKMPAFFFLFLALSMANLGLPLLSGFVGESMIFYSAFTSQEVLSGLQISAALSTIGVIITAGYMLWLAKRMFFGEELPKWSGLKDLVFSEKLVLFGFFFMSLILGVYPKLLTDKVEASASNMADVVIQSRQK
ncbi:MAG: NADH-quinone oxidoreductase subunit M [Candidatus Caenarcaniphilales bacterium]|nr:NADH-quinone oxidoreductase subunit M [Candidatus Caenarcaniphilales bacterium]